MIRPDHPSVSLSAKCCVLNISRSTLYYRPFPAIEETLWLMKAIDRLYTQYPLFGSRQFAAWLARDGILQQFVLLAISAYIFLSRRFSSAMAFISDGIAASIPLYFIRQLH